MKASWSTGIGLVLVLLGLVWTAQGLGWLEGSSMTDETFWAVAGVLTALVGAAVFAFGLRRSAR